MPGKNAADLFFEEINAKGGILGVPVKPVYVDEGAGTNQLISEYRRVVQDQGAQVMFGAISSGSCNALAPVAEDLKVVNVMWDCGTQTIFEDGKWKYSVRTQGHAGAEMMATLLYLMKTKPDFKTIAVVNQDYAWGREILGAALGRSQGAEAGRQGRRRALPEIRRARFLDRDHAAFGAAGPMS